MKRIEDYPILFVWTNENKKKNKKEKIQTKSAWDHLTPSIVHMFCVCVYACAISSMIILTSNILILLFGW